MQKLPTVHNGPTLDYRLTAFASTVQSKPCRSQTALLAVDTSRTSVSKLRKSFEAAQQGNEGNNNQTARTPTDLQVMVIPVIKKSGLRAPIRTTNESMEARPGLNAISEQTTKPPLRDEPARLKSPGLLKLKTPVWDKHGGQNSASTDSFQPRRSKKSQQTSARTTQHRSNSESGRRNDHQEYDVSPKSSTGPGTPLSCELRTSRGKLQVSLTGQDPLSCIHYAQRPHMRPLVIVLHQYQLRLRFRPKSRWQIERESLVVENTQPSRVTDPLIMKRRKLAPDHSLKHHCNKPTNARQETRWP